MTAGADRFNEVGLAVLRFILMACALLAAAGAALAQLPSNDGPHLKLELVAESEAPAPGGAVALAIHARPEPGWHGYWTNPGDAGVPDRFAWTLPAGASVGGVRYPVPQRLLISGIMNYVFEDDYALLTELRVPVGAAAGARLPIAVKVDYLVCTREICVPEAQTLRTELTVGDGRIDPAARARFDAWRAALPRPLGSQARFRAADGRLTIAIPLPAGAAAADPYFFPAEEGLIDHSAPQQVTREGDLLTTTTAAERNASGARAIAGVLALGPGRGVTVEGVPGAVDPPQAAGGFGWGTLLAALGGAVLGGLILNVMPCVFPILSLKALSLAKGGVSEGAARADALAYAAGVIATCVALGGVLLALRAGGEAAGWAFQLQYRWVLLLLLLLVMAIALNLAGLFEIGGPGFANRLAASGKGGAFLTGALAAFVATPCAGPFMGAALGAALVLPWAAALAVFAGLGLGIALPFLAVGFVPALRRRLPKPGAWMARLRRILSIPMFLTALALAWVLGRQAGVDGMTIALAAALVLAVALWWSGRRQLAGQGGAWWPVLPAVLLAAGAAVLIERAPAEAKAASASADEPFSEARLAALRAENRPVFAYFTADWCLTCKVNERVAISTAAARNAFAANDTAVLVGDWTDGDPALGRFIESHGRSGVPLYLYWAPGAASPQILPQVLTPDMLAGLSRGES